MGCWLIGPPVERRCNRHLGVEMGARGRGLGPLRATAKILPASVEKRPGQPRQGSITILLSQLGPDSSMERAGRNHGARKRDAALHQASDSEACWTLPCSSEVPATGPVTGRPWKLSVGQRASLSPGFQFEATQPNCQVDREGVGYVTHQPTHHLRLPGHPSPGGWHRQVGNSPRCELKHWHRVANDTHALFGQHIATRRPPHTTRPMNRNSHPGNPCAAATDMAILARVSGIRCASEIMEITEITAARSILGT